jgi:oligosaccharyltransferase complex subunit epsilon
MAPKKNAAASAPATKSSTTPLATSTATTAQPNEPSVSVTKPVSIGSKSSTNSRNPQTAQEILESIWNNYVEETPQRAKLIDVFMGFLLVVGGLQFLYCVIAGNYVSPSSMWQVLQFLKLALEEVKR